MKQYTRLTTKEREEISLMLHDGCSLNTIAKTLERTPSTLSRELQRNHFSKSNYCGAQAQERANRIQHSRSHIPKLVKFPQLRQFVFDALKKRWSPKEIAIYLKKHYPNDPTMNISNESIYTYVYVLTKGKLRKTLTSYLLRHHKKRFSKSHNRHKYKPIQDMTSIEERPKEVQDRTVPGHWEGDLIMGAYNRSAIGTLVERTTRFTILVPLKVKDAVSVRKAFAREFKKLPSNLKRSMTYDQGQEMAQHRLFTKQTKVKVFFAHPHSPWERASNENTNCLIRSFFPKGTDFNQVSRKKIKEVQMMFNERPRQVIGWRFPIDAFTDLLH
jgi:transposase, IS30 family